MNCKDEKVELDEFRFCKGNDLLHQRVTSRDLMIKITKGLIQTKGIKMLLFANGKME